MLSSSQDVCRIPAKNRALFPLQWRHKLRIRIYCSSGMWLIVTEFLSFRLKLEMLTRKLKFRLLM